MPEKDPLKLAGLNIENEVPLAPFTTWRVGGPAKWLWHAEAERFAEVRTRAREAGIAVYYLGRGSNVLIDDEGLDGLVVCTRKTMQSVEVRGDLIVAEAGVPMPTLSKTIERMGFEGYEFLIGIPGNVGSGVALNAGVAINPGAGSVEIREMVSVVQWVDVVDRLGNVHRWTPAQCAFRHRGSRILDDRLFVVRAAFRLDRPGVLAEIKRRAQEHLEYRRTTQPLTANTAGSVFKRASDGQPAAVHIDRAGLKGHRIGGAIVSPKHANWIENDRDASADDIKALMNHIVTVVQDRFGVKLEREVRFLPQDLDVPG